VRGGRLGTRWSSGTVAPDQDLFVRAIKFLHDLVG
jgi:hypothetical protein